MRVRYAGDVSISLFQGSCFYGHQKPVGIFWVGRHGANRFGKVFIGDRKGGVDVVVLGIHVCRTIFVGEDDGCDRPV